MVLRATFSSTSVFLRRLYDFAWPRLRDVGPPEVVGFSFQGTYPLILKGCTDVILEELVHARVLKVFLRTVVYLIV